ncbi:MAG: hypothetical protein KatS3mg102_2680 [Planctomycetota bacterium]|nr:MAG: hypothetical protein KatS3mg102_2680 [Planctomycetota bacterium]
MRYISSFERVGIRKGREQGIRKGREEGIRKGREEGIRKGREERIRKGREEGIRKGREEGLRAGRLLALREAVVRCLQARFGPQARECAAQLARLKDARTLERLVGEAATVGSLGAFEELLRGGVGLLRGGARAAGARSGPACACVAQQPPAGYASRPPHPDPLPRKRGRGSPALAPLFPDPRSAALFP